MRRIEVAAGGSAAVAADPGPQILLVQRGSGGATSDSSFPQPEVWMRTAVLLRCANLMPLNPMPMPLQLSSGDAMQC